MVAVVARLAAPMARAIKTRASAQLPHAGAIISQGSGLAVDKIKALEKVGVSMSKVLVRSDKTIAIFFMIFPCVIDD